jgi:hypothetical protein
MKKTILVSAFSVLLGSTVAFSNQALNGWTIFANNSGVVDSMKYSISKAELNVDATITICLDRQGIVANGSIAFRDGVQRTLNMPQEGKYYWDNLHGAKTYWDYMKQQNRITSIDPQKGKLPASCFGPVSRVISNDGWEYIGELVEIPGNSDWFTIRVDGSLITIYRLFAREIQRI